MLRRNAFGTGAVVLVLGVAGCGGGSPSLSRAEFVRQANAACTKALAQARTSRSDVFTKVVAYENGTTAAIAALKPPAELKDDVDRYVRGQNAFVAYVKKFHAAVTAKQPLTALEAQGRAVQAQQAKLVRTLGLTACHL